jgi:MSHA biogenesis protein MshP
VSRPTGRPRGCAGRQSGFSLVVVIFVIVVLAALGAFAVQVAMTQYQSAHLELLEARAQAAAEAGLEYGANLALQRAPPTCLGTKTLNLTQEALAGFVVTVTCTPTIHQIYSLTTSTWNSYTVYALAATASYGAYGKPDYVARTAARNVTNAPP